MPTPPYTWVEFLDEPGASLAHMARHIRINGEDVLVKRDSVSVTVGDREVTEVTLTLLPSSVHFGAWYDHPESSTLRSRAIDALARLRDRLHPTR